jgi:hypothetical protein
MQIQKYTSDQSYCIELIGGAQIWIDEEKASKLQDVLTNTSGHKFIKINGQIISTSAIRGMFTSDFYEEMDLKRKGYWVCQHGKTYKANERCTCNSYPHFNG